MTTGELLKRLSDLGVATVTAEYDGYGDEGRVEEVRACDDAEKEIALPEDVSQAVDDAAVRYLEANHVNWYDSEGGYGEYILDVGKATQRLEHNERVSDVEYFEFEAALDLDGGEAPATPDAPVCTCPSLINGHHPGCPYAAATKPKS